MNEETRSRCLTHLREASLCLEAMAYPVLAVRLQDIIDTIDLEDTGNAEHDGFAWKSAIDLDYGAPAHATK